MIQLIKKVHGDPGDLNTIRTLFDEYQDFIGISLCFQSFEEELDSLPGKYSPDRRGNLYLANVDSAAAGCVAYYQVDETTCELKRLFVRPEFQGRGLGRQLISAAIEDAKSDQYEIMILDTLRRLESANSLYRQIGFAEIEPYNVNPHPDVAYFSKPLQ